MRRSWLKTLKRILAACLVAILVLVAVSMSLLRLAVAHAPQLRGELERVLTIALERPLTLGGMRASWAGRHPRLILEDVRLAGEGSLANMEIPELEVDVDLWRSLRTMRLRLAQVTVSDLLVHGEYQADGSLRLTRIGNAFVMTDQLGDTGPRELPARLQLKNATVQLTDQLADSTYRLTAVDLTLDARAGNYALGGYIPLPATLGRSIRFRAEWRGGDGSEALAGRFYVDARHLRLAPLSPLLERWLPIPAMQGSLDAELWADLTPQGLSQLGGQVAVFELGLQSEAGGAATLVAGQAKGQFQWRQQQAGWELDVAELMFASAYRVWPKTSLALNYAAQQDSQTLTFHGDYLHVGDLAPALASLPILSTEQRQALLQANPTAALFEPRVKLQWQAGALQAFDGYARFESAGLQAVQALPGATGLHGEIWADQDGGYLQLDAGKGVLDIAQVFRAPLPFDALEGEASWRIGAGGWVLEAPRLAVTNEDGRGQARLRLTGGAQSPLFIDLRAHVSEGVSRDSVPRYLPVPVLPSSVLKWLDEAGISGQVAKADVLLYGQIDRFPFDDSGGVFHVQADFTDTSLDYRTGWPRVESASGSLAFINDRMEIQLSAGRIHGASISGAQARIARLGRDPLQINGKLRGSGQQFLSFVSESPLGDGLRDQLHDMRLSGQHDLTLRIQIPFDGAAVGVQGSIALQQAAYSIPKWDLFIDRLQGEVHFTERGVRAEGVSGLYRDLPVLLSASTRGRVGTEKIYIEGQLQASPAALLGTDSLWGVAGQADWNLRLELPGFQAKIEANAPLLDLHVDSSLAGVSIDLPKPLGKAAGDERPLRFSLPIYATGLGLAHMSYSDEVHIELELVETGVAVNRFGVQLGVGSLQLPAQGGLIQGQLDELDLEGWTWPEVDGQANDSSWSGAIQADLEIGRLRAVGQQFQDVGLQLRPASDGWSLLLSGPDLAGTVALPSAPEQPVVAMLEHLRLQVPELRDSSAKTRLPEDSRSTSLPALRLEVLDLLLHDQSLGRLDVATQRTDAGLSLEQAQIIGPLLELKATGGWNRERARSQLAVTMASSNTGRLLDALGYVNAMRGGDLQGRLSVEWDGSYSDFALAALSGSLDMRVRDGQILQVEPGAGRLFGLLSIGELPRRLSLDFSDLFGKGFAFDKIETHLQLADGNAYTRDFHMEGPSARVELDGRIGLVARDYDQRVLVTPNVSTALPAIGAVAAGPVGAVAGFVTQKLLQKEINRLSRYRYRVAGSWDAPQIEPISGPEAETEATNPVSAAQEVAVP